MSVSSIIEAGLFARGLAASGAALCIVVRTSTAYRRPLAREIAVALKRRCDIGDETALIMETVLHEALMNAILHGNLGLNSEARQGFGMLDRFQSLIDHRLKLPQFSNKPLVIGATWTSRFIDLSVRDDGTGYSAKPRALPDESRASGRGLAIIQALAAAVSFKEGGRLIEMRIAR
ncbi:MAG: ATP-binding protein [Alphaproteobacteria bacterium]|nr:ATP-binding protein [Alphaproteobacteria bacterium]